MVKRLKRASKIDEKKCYIEELPDELLGDIVSRLKTNEAARACRVSRRWRNVSRFVLSSSQNLDFDFSAKKRRNYNRTEFARCTLIGMAKHKEPLVDNLRIALDHTHIRLYNSQSHSIFMDMLMFANIKRVQSLDIDIKAHILLESPELFLLETRRFITVAGKLPFVEKPWDRLTTLSLKSVQMYDETVDKLLPNSPNLETLLLQNILCTKLEVKDTNPKLKRLEIVDCACLDRVHIVSAPNLESLKLIPWMNKYYESFKRKPFKKITYLPNIGLELISTNIAPKLEAIYLGGPLCRNLVLDVQKYAHQLKKLHLNMDLDCDHVGCWIDFPTVPTLGNLKQLELTFTSTQTMDHDKDKLHTITCIINSCPFLEKLTLKYEIQKVDMADEDCYFDSYRTNKFLEEVEIVGWSGLKSEIDLVLHLIRTSPKLQRLCFDPTPPQMSGFRVFPPVIRTEHELQSAALIGQLIGCLHKKIVK